MIISDRVEKKIEDFEKLLSKADVAIKRDAKHKPEYYINQDYKHFEEDVFNVLKDSAKGTVFDGSIYLISGLKFPDIIINKCFGVEVKTTKQNHWRSTGNSVLESSRIEDVERIYVYFAKLSNPPMFKYKLYQKCLYDIAVTHSPRYLIDMEINEEQSIFSKIGINYDDLRKKENPIKPFIDYYRENVKPGEAPWWMDSGESLDGVLKPTVTIMRNLNKNEQLNIVNQAMARFPELFGKSSAKFQNYVLWLTSRHGIIDPSSRDRFTAGGKVDIEVNNNTFRRLPHIFEKLKNNIKNVLSCVKEIPEDEAKYHWQLSNELNKNDKIIIWSKKVTQYASEISSESKKFIVNLLHETLYSSDLPQSFKEWLEENR